MGLARYTADEEYDRRVERVRTACNLSDDVEVLRLAMSTIFALVDHLDDGGRILLEGKDGTNGEYLLLNKGDRGD